MLAGQIHFPARRRAAAGGDFGGGGGGDEGGGDFALGFAAGTLPHGYAHVPVDHVGAPLRTRRDRGGQRSAGVTYRAESLPVRSALLSVAAKDVPTTAQLRVMEAAGER